MRPNPRDAAPPHLALTSTWSIRSKIIAVLLVPLVTLIVMWVVATWVTVPPGVALIDAQTTVDAVGRPTQALVTELQAERKLAVAHLAAADAADDDTEDDAEDSGSAAVPDPRELAEQHERTDAAVAELRSRTGADEARAALTDTGSARLSELLLHLDTLDTLRDDVASLDVDRAGALRRYTQMIEAALSLSRSLIRIADENLLREAQALLTMSEARELLAREDAVVAGALAAGAFSQQDLTQAVTLIGAQRHQFGLADEDLHVTDRLAYEAIASSAPAGTLLALEDILLVEARVGQAPPIDEATWRDAYRALTDDLRALELDAAQRLVERARPQAVFIFGRIAVTGALGLIALAVTAFASLRVAQSLLRRLAGLRQAAKEVSIDRLPRVVERLRRGEQVDVAAEAPPLPYGSDEIGQVGHAFNALQRTAIAAAVAEADLRRGVNEVFLNIARRSQTLLHRQLSILDGMERRAEDPVELEDLFRVDHLATRMRRNAEYLVILAGAAPGRGWRQPVPLVDVLRGAVSEVEDYARVTVRPVPELAVTGRAVGDVIHLLAELIENATTFSPPTTKVVVGAEQVTNGLAIEIEDRGIGILPPILEELNARLVDPPEFDPGAGAQLGLFVVARLASRHGISVQLRRSAYGGTTAVALLPEALLTAPADRAALPAGSTGDLVPLDAGSPHAPRSAGNSSTLGFTPVTVPGDPLPSRRGSHALEDRALPPASAVSAGAGNAGAVSAGAGNASAASGGGNAGAGTAGGRLEDAETAVIIATAGKPSRRPGRHARPEVIEPVDDPDGLPKRVRQRGRRRDAVDADLGSGAVAAGGAAAVGGGPSDGDRIDTSTRADDARSPEQIRAMMSSFQAGTDRGRREAEVAQGEQSSTGGDTAKGGRRAGRRRADRGVDGDTTVEAT